MSHISVLHHPDHPRSAGYRSRHRLWLAAAVLSMIVAVPAMAVQDMAEVINTQPVMRTVQVAEPVQQCYQQPAAPQPSGSGSAIGTVLGAVVGGVTGYQFGGGSGKAATTALGAVVGSVAGRSIANNANSNQPPTTTQQQCQTVTQYHPEQQPDGFDVTYRYAGQVYHAHLPYDPGTQLPVNVSVTPNGRY